jgi:hypothetical protein
LEIQIGDWVMGFASTLDLKCKLRGSAIDCDPKRVLPGTSGLPSARDSVLPSRLAEPALTGVNAAASAAALPGRRDDLGGSLLDGPRCGQP